MARDDSVSGIQLYLLGPPRLVRRGESFAALRRSKSQALLYYLAVTGSPQRRATLAALLWPDSAEQKAAMSLRTALSDLRKLLGEQLVVTGQTVSLKPEALRLDVAQFEELLRRTGDDEVDALQGQAAVSLYGGDFLAGFHAPGAPDFERWMALERERLRQAMLQALLALAAWHEAQRDLAASLDQLTRLLAMEPASEAGHRQKMVVLARMGQRSAALLQYEACRRALAEELGVDPAPETSALRDLILAGTLGAAPSAINLDDQGSSPAPPRVQPRGRPLPAVTTQEPAIDWGDLPDRSAFYGREEDLSLLNRWLTNEGAGLVVIAGMGGVGKTTLATEAVARLAPETYDLVVCRSLVNAPPLAAMLDNWLQALTDPQLDRPPTTLDEKLALLFGELQIRRCLLVLDNAESIMQAGARGGYFLAGYEDYGQLIARMGRSRHRSCLLLTTRDLPRGLRRMEEDHPRTRILALEGLSTSPGRQLLRGRGVVAPAAALEMLVERYSGNPLALKLVADMVRDLFGADVAAFLRDETPLFEDIRSMLDEQYARLSDLQRELITWLAIERRPVAVPILRNDLVRPPAQGQFLGEIDSLRRGSLVDEAGGDGHDAALLLRLQNVVMEYVTERLLHAMLDELESGVLSTMQRHALVQAQSPEYVQESQRRLLLQPVARQLVERLGRAGAVQRLEDLLKVLHTQAAQTPGYAAANILHLLIELQANVQGLDLSQLAVWQADLRKASLLNVDLRGADLTGSTFCETFGAIASVAVSPDGRLLAAGGTDGIVHVWQSADFQPAHGLAGHALPLTTLAFTQDGRYLASGGFDEAICVWDMETGALVRTLRRPAAPLQAWAICIHDELLAAVGTDATLHVWNWRSGEALRSLTPPGLMDAVAFSPDGRLLAAAGETAEVVLWDAHTGELLRRHPAGEQRVLALAFDGDGKTLASGGEDNCIHLWRTHDFQLLGTLVGHSNWVLSLAFSPRGKQLASGSADHTARLWAVEEKRPVRLLSGHGGWVRSVAYTPDGRGLATGSHDQTVRLWDTRTGELRHALQGTMRWIDLTQFSPDGRTLISTSLDGSMHLWDVENHTLLRQLQEPQAVTRALAFSHDGARVLCGSDDHMARLWDTRSGALVEALHGHQGPVRSVAISPDGRFLVTSSHDDTLRVWDGAAQRLHLVLPDVHARIQFAIAFHPGGDLLACCRLDHSISLLHPDSGKVLASIPMANKSPGVVAFDVQGRRLACGGRDGAVGLWDLDVTGSGPVSVSAQARQVQLSGEAIWRLLFSPDARLLACVGAGQDAYVLDAATGQVRYSVPNPYGAYCLEFSRDSSRLVTAGADYAVLLRDASTGDVLQALRGHTSGLTSLSVSPDGTRLASSSADGTVRLWRLDTGEHLATLEPDGPYSGMNISGATGITAAQRATLMSLGAVVDS